MIHSCNTIITNIGEIRILGNTACTTVHIQVMLYMNDNF